MKFKVGDRVTIKSDDQIHEITGLDSHSYCLDNNQTWHTENILTRYPRTIEDVQTGDIVVNSNGWYFGILFANEYVVITSKAVHEFSVALYSKHRDTWSRTEFIQSASSNGWKLYNEAETLELTHKDIADKYGTTPDKIKVVDE